MTSCPRDRRTSSRGQELQSGDRPDFGRGPVRRGHGAMAAASGMWGADATNMMNRWDLTIKHGEMYGFMHTENLIRCRFLPQRV